MTIELSRIRELRKSGRTSEALATLHHLLQQHPGFSLLHQERGYCYVSMRDAPRAIEAFRRSVSLNPALAASWGMLERLYRMLGEVESAATAAKQVSNLEQMPPEVVRAGSLFSDGELAAAENILRSCLGNARNDFEALRLLGRIEHQRNALHEAELLLDAALKLAPDYDAARLDYVHVLMDRQKYLPALEEINVLLRLEPGNTHYRALCAAAHAGLGRHESATVFYRDLLAESPESVELYVTLGHSLKSIGRQKEAIESYQKAAELKPSFGDAYWSLANLKTYRFSDDEIARMRVQEALPAVQGFDRYHLCFALGKAYEDRHEYTESWLYYERGNRLKRAESRYRSDVTESETRKQIEVCTAEFFSAHAGVGVPDPDPIFIVGLPRSGSTLIEQILASHSQVEGTQELPDIQRIALELPGPLTELAPDKFRTFGERYITDTRAFRSKKPYFIDKMPNNFRHIGLIHLMLPNAKIIDVRREPMGCCFSNLKQLYAKGQEFSYGIKDVAHYYRTYLDLMRHWDAVLSGRILRVCYEDVVEDLERNVRRILEFCGLEFESGCVEFYKTERNVYTPSSEQVRQPIFSDGLAQWRNYEGWLSPLKDSLGDARIRYRE